MSAREAQRTHEIPDLRLFDSSTLRRLDLNSRSAIAIDVMVGVVALEFIAETLGAHGPARTILARLSGSRDLPALAALAQTPETIEDDVGHLGKYTLHRKLPCSPPEQCFEASADDRSVFLRTFPRERMTDPLVARLKRWAQQGEILDLGIVDHQPYLISPLIHGIDLRRFATSLPIALGLLGEAMSLLRAIHNKGELHGHLTPGRIRIDPYGAIRLCFGTSELPENESKGADRCTAASLILRTAIDDAALFEILAQNEDEALVVAADRLEELHPELDELIASAMSDRDADLLPLLRPHVSANDATKLIEEVVRTSRSTP